MTGNTITQFMDDLLTMGGPEKDFIFRQKRYFLETEYCPDKNLLEMYVFEVSDTDPVVFSCFGKNFRECVEQFEKAQIFDGMTIYEAEHEIEVLFG